MLSAVGGGAVAGVAGCSQGGDSGDGSGTTSPSEGATTSADGEGDPKDLVYNGFYTLNPPDDLYFNPFGPIAAGMGLHHWGMLFVGLARYRPLKPEVAMSGIYAGHPRHTDPIEDGTATIQVRDDRTWHDGDKYTAQDLRTEFMMNLYMKRSGGAEGSLPYEDVRVVDDYAIEVDMRDTTTPHDPWWDAMYGANLGIAIPLTKGPVWVKHSEWESWFEKFTDATSDDELQSVAQDLQQVRRPFEETVGHGPFKIKEIRGQTVVYEPWEEWNGLIATNWPNKEQHARVGTENHSFWLENDMTAEITFISERSVLGQAALSGDLDYTRLSSESQGRELIDQHGWKKVPFTGDIYSSGTIVWYHVNFDYPPLAKRKVRQALLHLMPQKQLARVGYQKTRETTRQSPVPIPAPVGVSWATAKIWMDEAAIESNWSTYDVTESNKEKAASLLREAGLSKSNGKWMTEDGERFTLDIRQSVDRAVAISQTFEDVLNGFGIATSFTAVEGTLVSKTLADGDYDLFHASNENNPTWPGGEFQEAFNGQKYPWGGKASRKSGHPEKWEVPSTIGDPDSSLETVDVVSKVQKLNQQGNDHERLVRELSWAFNQTVPSLMYLNGEYKPSPSDQRPVGQLYNANKWHSESREENYGKTINFLSGTPGYPEHQHHYGGFVPKRE